MRADQTWTGPASAQAINPMRGTWVIFWEWIDRCGRTARPRSLAASPALVIVLADQATDLIVRVIDLASVIDQALVIAPGALATAQVDQETGLTVLAIDRADRVTAQAIGPAGATTGAIAGQTTT